MKVCHFSKNFSSQNKLILKIQSSIELSQTQGILSNYSEVFLFFAKYNFLFENVSSEAQHLKNIRTNIESSLSTQDPARDGNNWYDLLLSTFYNTDRTYILPIFYGMR